MKLQFAFQKLLADRVIRWQAILPCIRCGAAVTVTRGEVQPLLTVDREFVGIVCLSCLSPQSRARLADRRRAQECGP